MNPPVTERVFGMEAQKGRWLLVVAGFLINICLGSVYAYSVFRNPVQTLFSCNVTQSGLPFMVFLAFFAILMFFGGKLMGTMGPKKISIIGGALVGTGWILSGILPQMIPSIWTLVFTYGIIAGSGVGLVYGAPLAVANRWFPDRKGLAVGLTVAGFGGSPFVTANLARPLIQSNGCLYTFTVMGIGLLVIIIALAFVLRFPAAGWKPAGLGAAKAAATALVRADFEPHAMVRTSTFMGLFLVYTIGCLAGLMAIGIASPVGTEIIMMDAATAASMVGIFALFNGAGRPLFGWLTDRITPRWAATISMIVILLASLVMLRAAQGTTALYAIAFAALWMCLGGWLAIGPTATATFFGAKNYARNYSYVFFGYGLAAILANFIAGSSKDLFGSYNTAFLITGILAAVGAVLALMFMKPPKK
jgi:OFA family oxalate/formate antiporter-like MFS transporter